MSLRFHEMSSTAATLRLSSRKRPGGCADDSITVALSVADPGVVWHHFNLLQETLGVQPRCQNFIFHVLTAEPPEHAFPAVDDLRDLAQDLLINIWHQQEVAMIFVNVIV